MSPVTSNMMRQLIGVVLQTFGWLSLLAATSMFLLGMLAFAALPFPFLAPDMATLVSALFLVPVGLVPLSVGLIAGGRSLRTKRILWGHCPTCGYDLRMRANDVCPECGSPC